MRAVTQTQPYATLVATGQKKIETRSWQTSYRGTLAIHAAKGFPKWAKDLCYEEPFDSALGGHIQTLPFKTRRPELLPLGCVVATVDLVDIYPTERVYCNPLVQSGTVQHGNLIISSQEHAFGDYSPGRFAWVMENVRPLPEPVPAKGMLSLWEWDASAVFPNLGHGHVIPRSDGLRARCGGPALCAECAAVAHALTVVRKGR